MSNPTLTPSSFSNAGPVTAEGAMTINGAVTKTAILTCLVVASATWVWSSISSGNPSELVTIAASGGWIVGLIAGLIVSFVPRSAPWLSPLYAVGQGCFLGMISNMYEKQFHGIVLTSVLLTCGVLFAMLAAYTTGLLRPTAKFQAMVIAATGGICIVYVLSMVLGIFGIHIPGIFGNGMVGIGFSLLVVGIAALNFIIDFGIIEEGAAHGAPKYMEWYSAFGLLVTLIWLYLEILRLLSKLRSRD